MMLNVSSSKQPINSQQNQGIPDIVSSDSEGEQQFHFIKHKVVRPLSDYETDESSDSRAIRVVTRKNELESDSTTPHSDCDSSTDESVMTRRRVKSLKRPLSSTSTSDLSDSDVPLSSIRFSKRRKLIYSSESSDSEGLVDAGEHQIESQAARHEQTNNTNIELRDNRFLLAENPRFEEEENNSDIMCCPQDPERRVQQIESESESELVSTTHIVRGRRLPVIESEDESVSSNEYTSRTLRIGTVQGITDQTVGSELHAYNTRNRRRNTLRVHVNESNVAINLSYSASNPRNVRRIRVHSNNMNSDRQNTWRVINILAEESEDDSVLVSNGRRVRGRRIPVLESENDSDSSSNTPSNRETFIINGEIEVVNNESSNSDSSIRPRALSNRTFRILQSDDSTSSSSSTPTDSDDSIPIRNPRRRRPIPIIDNEYVDIANEFSMVFDVKIEASAAMKAHANHEVLNGNSSDTDGESEKCPICLTGFKLQEIGKPQSCDHKFCSLCIKEWATKNNTCPVDRKVFNGIVVYEKNEGKVIYELPVGNVSTDFDELDLMGELFAGSSDDSSRYASDGDGPEEVCSVCWLSHLSQRMITCDDCNAVFHLECLNPPLRDIPVTDWYCRDCLASSTLGSMFEVSSDSN